jgi:hypothetical protein
MPKFKKLIVTPGTHKVGRLDGRSEVVPITAERIRTWVENTNKAKALGVKVPAPFAHQDSNLNFPLPVVLGTDGASLADAYKGHNGLSWDAQLNGGFWEDDFAVDPTTGGLVGHVESPGDEKDANTPAGKVGTVVKETSVFVMGPRTVVVNGVEHEIGEHLAHVAMCLHAAQPGQKNFEPLQADEIKGDKSLQLAMSFCMADMIAPQQASNPAATSGISNNLPDPTKPRDQELANCLAMLRNVCYIDLPEETDRETFITNLSLALRQKSADQQETQRKEESLTSQPPGSETKSPSIAMSNLVNTAGAAPSLNANAPTGSAAPAASPTSADTVLTLMMNNLIVDKKTSLRKRIDALVSSGRLRKDRADAKYYPRIEALTMTSELLMQAGGNVNKLRDPVEDLIEELEQTAPLAGPSLTDDSAYSYTVPNDAQVQELHVASGPDQGLDAATEDSIIEDAMQMVGM